MICYLRRIVFFSYKNLKKEEKKNEDKDRVHMSFGTDP